ncbi:MAG: ribonuclease HII [Chloroflexota bacterium]
MTNEQICGLDEAGRGPLAGPLVAAAVIFPADFVFTEVFPKLKFGDSKKMSLHQREAVISYIHEFALATRVEVVSVEDINRQGIGWANRAAFERLIVGMEAERYIVDGNLKLTNLGRKARRVRSLVRADQTEQAVSAASIIAKVTRDRIMQDLHATFPVYGWDHNMGYGTAQHVDALQRFGLTVHHRYQFVTSALSKKTPLLPGLDEGIDVR